MEIYLEIKKLVEDNPKLKGISPRYSSKAIVSLIMGHKIPWKLENSHARKLFAILNDYGNYILLTTEKEDVETLVRISVDVWQACRINSPITLEKLNKGWKKMQGHEITVF